MIGRRRLGVLATAAALLLALTLGALVFVPFDSPELGRRALERLGAFSGARITARAFRLRLWQGLALEGAQVWYPFTGGEAEVSLDRLVLDHRLLPLFLGRWEVERILLVRPRIKVREVPAGPPPPAAFAAAPLALRITAIDVKDGSFEWRSRASSRPTTGRGVDLRIRDVAFAPGSASIVAALSGRGELKIEEIGLETTTVRDLRGALRLAGGRASSDTVRFRTDQGAFEATFSASLLRLPMRYQLRLKGDPLKLDTMAGPGTGRGLGAGSIELAADGLGPEPEGLTGKGVLRLQAGTLPSTPLLARLEAALGRTHIVGAPYRATETPFRIERGRVLFDGFRVEAQALELETGGWLSLRGPLELRIAARVPREDVRLPGVPEGALDLLTDEQRRLVVPVTVTGTRENPVVRPDTGAMLAQARQGGTRALAERAAEGLKSLFGRKR